MLFARVVKLVDAGDSKSPAARRAGSIPAPGTISEKPFLRKQRRLFRIGLWLKVDYRICDRQTVEPEHLLIKTRLFLDMRFARLGQPPSPPRLFLSFKNPTAQTDIMCAR